ncbi:MAG: Lrp/AsnC family transcriptional regulator [Candidatus Nanoarchaeia archaeon]
MKSFQLSKQEKKILSILRADSRKGYKDIAKATGVAISTVHNTIKRLVNAGVIKNFSVKLESKKLGFDITVIVGVKVKHGSLEAVEKRLSNHPNVCQLFIVTGEFDLMLIAKFSDTDALNDFIRNFIQGDTGTERTNTSLVLTTIKERLNPLLGFD